MSSSGIPRTKALGRAVDILRAVADRPSTSASELARLSGLPRSTVARTLRTLADEGMVEELDGGWVVGRGLLRLARAADPDRGFVDAARPIVERLRDETGESALVALTRGRPGMEVVLQADPSRHVGVASWVAVDVPLHASAAGKLILAELTEPELDAWLRKRKLARFTRATITDAAVLRAELRRAHRRGWAELVDELEDGLAAIAVDVRDAEGTLVGAIGISGPTFRLGRARRRELLPIVQNAARRLEKAAC